MQLVRQLFALLVLSGLMAYVPAHAETYHTCGTIIASAPAVISTQGVYCLTHDLATSITTGQAILVNANNVTIDCNGYKIGGLAGGSSSSADGIYADSTRLNTTVRNCGIRGYYYGIDLQGSGNLVEDNRLDNNLYTGIQVLGDNNRVQRNRVYDTGGYPGNTDSTGIIANGDIIDNTVAGVFATTTNSSATGLWANSTGDEVRGNQLRDLAATGTGQVLGIKVNAGGITVRGNSMSLSTVTAGVGIAGNGSTDSFCLANTVHKFATGITNCQLGSDNLTN